MEASKIHLSEAEMRLMRDAETILTKNAILNKVRLLLEGLQDRQMAFAKQKQLAELSLFQPAPKISRGENYLGLPYQVLDYPRYSQGEDLFFIRSMFWWGHFFSSTLQLAGRPRKEASVHLAKQGAVLLNGNYHIGIHPDPWIHHAEPDNYKKLDEQMLKDITTFRAEQAHMKIAMFFSLEDWPEAGNMLFESWSRLLNAAGLIAQPME